jgi:hypothetical protein
MKPLKTIEYDILKKINIERSTQVLRRFTKTLSGVLGSFKTNFYHGKELKPKILKIYNNFKALTIPRRQSTKKRMISDRLARLILMNRRDIRLLRQED